MKKHQFPTYKAICTSYNSIYNDHRCPSCKQKGDLFGAKNPSPLACEQMSSKSMTGWFEGPSGNLEDPTNHEGFPLATSSASFFEGQVSELRD